MKKYMHAGVMAVLMLIVAAICVACDSKDEPESSPRLVSFSWDNPKDNSHFYPDETTLVAEYSEKERQLSITFENMCIYARDGYKGFITSEGNNIGIGFSVPYNNGLVESPTLKDLKWIVEVPCSGQYAIEIYYIGVCNTFFPSYQIRNSLLLTTLDLDLDSDFTRTFKVRMPPNYYF